jgi:hypothetical protein
VFGAEKAKNMISNRSSLFLAALVLWSALELQAQTVVSTPIVGFANYNLSAGQYVFSPTFLKPQFAQGNAVITGQNLPASGLSASSLVPTSHTDGRPNYPTAYVEVLSGTYAGVAFDIVAASSSGVTAAFPADLNGISVSYVIRPHITLADVIKADSGFAEYSDVISVYNSDGSISLRYLAGGVITTDDFATEAGHTPVYPGTGVILNLGAQVALKVSGQVKMTSTKVPVYPSINNIVGTMNPSSDLKLTDSSFATSLAPYADSAVVYSNDGSFSLSTIVFSDGASVTDDNFNPFSSATSPVLPSGTGAIINVASGGYVELASPVTP